METQWYWPPAVGALCDRLESFSRDKYRAAHIDASSAMVVKTAMVPIHTSK